MLFHKKRRIHLLIAALLIFTVVITNYLRVIDREKQDIIRSNIIISKSMEKIDGSAPIMDDSCRSFLEDWITASTYFSEIQSLTAFEYTKKAMEGFENYTKNRCPTTTLLVAGSIWRQTFYELSKYKQLIANHTIIEIENGKN